MVILFQSYIKKKGEEMYKVTAYSMWKFPEDYYVETEEEANELKKELKNEQYLVEIENIEEGE